MSTDDSGMRQQGRAIGRRSRSVNKQALWQGRGNSRDGTRVQRQPHSRCTVGWIASIASNAQRHVGQEGPLAGLARATAKVRSSLGVTTLAWPELYASDMIDRHSRNTEPTWNLYILGKSRFSVV
ncbi:hypothetical protein E4T39_08015 [Aureobasidium subglaciale]|nr:hypothetical protein E4T39_08015 [Aureobasidium subglaciale]